MSPTNDGSPSPLVMKLWHQTSNPSTDPSTDTGCTSGSVHMPLHLAQPHRFKKVQNQQFRYLLKITNIYGFRYFSLANP